jgi:uncharacterized membrane protein
MASNVFTKRRGQAWALLAVGAVLVLVGVALFSGFFLLPRLSPALGYYFYPFGWLWLFFGFFLIFGLIRALLWPWRWGGHRRRYWYGYGYGNDDAYRILRERYARGEIAKDQLDQMTRDLDQHR